MYTQDDRIIAAETPLGRDVLLLQSFSGIEGISRPFQFRLNLACEKPPVALSDLVGQRVDIRLTLRDEEERYINGFVSRFSQIGKDERFAYYRAEVHPWLWFLTRTFKCRIFQDMTVPEIIAKVFKDLGFNDFRDDLRGSYEPREYCVQYRESDLNFVSRLMEEYGIYYFFEHEKGKHTLVLADAPSAHSACPHQETARYFFSQGAEEDEDVVRELQIEQELRPGKYTLTDYNFKTPSTRLEATVSSVVDVGGNANYEVYDYPGEYEVMPQGEGLVRLRMEEEEATHLLVRGSGTCRAFVSGYKFKLEEHFDDEANTDLLLVEVQHTVSGGEFGGEGAGALPSYANQFTCIPAKTTYRAPRSTPRPIVQGPQTAVVVGPGGEKIYVDKYGRVKVQFHWDREGKKDENSSCWMRVSQAWAGADWGGMFIPHIGQEVIVSFLEGDPDQPIITGRVYNAEKMPPLSLPGNMTKSAIRDHGGNEIIMEGEPGKQQMRLFSPTHNTSITMGNSITIFTSSDEKKDIGGDSKESIIGDLEVKVGGDVGEIFLGVKHDTVVGSRTEITFGNKNESTVGLLSEMCGGIKVDIHKGKHFVHQPDEVELTNTRRVQKASEEYDKLDQLKQLISGICTQKISTMKQDITTMQASIGSMEYNVKSLTKVVAGTLKLESKGTVSINASGRVDIKGTACMVKGNTDINGDLFVGRVFSAKK